MKDKIVFVTIEQAFRFVKQFPYSGFIRRENDVAGDISGLNLSFADLAGANLANLYLDGVDLTGAKLDGANLRGAHLSHASVSDTTILWIDTKEWSSRGDDIYASPVYDNGNQIGWGFHAGCFYGNYKKLREEIVRKHYEGGYAKCLDELQKMCMAVFNPTVSMNTKISDTP